MASEVFLANVPIKLSDIYDLCADTDQLRNYLLKSGLLGDYSGVCDSCGEGNVGLNKDRDSYFWRCSKQGCRKKISLRKGSFFEGSKLDFKTILCLIFFFYIYINCLMILLNLNLISNHNIPS